MRRRTWPSDTAKAASASQAVHGAGPLPVRAEASSTNTSATASRRCGTWPMAPPCLSQSLEEASPPGQIYVDAATRSLAGEAIDVRALAAMAVGGRAEPVPVFELSGLGGGASEVEAIVSGAMAHSPAAYAAHDRAAH